MQPIGIDLLSCDNGVPLLQHLDRGGILTLSYIRCFSKSILLKGGDVRIVCHLVQFK